MLVNHAAQHGVQWVLTRRKGSPSVNPRLFTIPARISLFIFLISVAAIALSLGPLEDKLRTRYVWVDGTVKLYVGDRQQRRPILFIQLPWITIAAAALPMYQLAHRCRRVSRGLCLSCGYDLRGTPERCPECGTCSRDAIASRLS